MTPWTVTHQAPLSTGFPRQACWSGLPFPSPGDLPNPGIKLQSSVHLLHYGEILLLLVTGEALLMCSHSQNLSGSACLYFMKEGHD